MDQLKVAVIHVLLHFSQHKEYLVTYFENKVFFSELFLNVFFLQLYKVLVVLTSIHKDYDVVI